MQPRLLLKKLCKGVADDGLTLEPIVCKRSTFYEDKKQLMLPFFNEFWGQNEVAFTSPAKVEVIEEHTLVTRTFSFKTYLLGRTGTAKGSDTNLTKVGGQVTESYVLPIDPTLIMQNVGYSCTDEDQFPRDSPHSEVADVFYDDTCEAGEPSEEQAKSGTCQWELTGCHW